MSDGRPKLNNAKSLYLEGIRDGNYCAAVNKYTGERYTQHSTGVKDGKEGFIEFFSGFVEKNPSRDIQIIRGWEDGMYVFVQAYQNINKGEAEWVTTDFFYTQEDNKIIEHWDVISKYSPTNPSGHSSVDGTTEITDFEKTDENKQLVKEMIENLLFKGGDLSSVDKYIAGNYIQHNKEVPDGRELFKALLHDKGRPLWYDEIVLLVGCGNFVATLCKARWNDDQYAQVDIFRIEDGKIVEHWDNTEPVPAPEDSVNGGKF